MLNLRSTLSISIVLITLGSLANDKETSEIRENLASVAQNSKNLASSVGSLLYSVGNEVISQTQKWGNSVSAYVESLKQSSSEAFQISIQENSDHVAVVINSLENIDTSSCCQAKLTIQETWPIRVTATIQVNPDTVIALYSSGYNDLSVDLVTIVKQVTEEQKDGEVVNAATSKQQKIVKRITTERPIDLTKLAINLDMTKQQMMIDIPYMLAKEEVVPVTIK